MYSFTVIIPPRYAWPYIRQALNITLQQNQPCNIFFLTFFLAIIWSRCVVTRTKNFVEFQSTGGCAYR